MSSHPIILNLTLQNPEKIGIFTNLFEPQIYRRNRISELLTFTQKPTSEEIDERVISLVEICTRERTEQNFDFDKVLIHDIPPFMISTLETWLYDHGFCPVFAYPNIQSATDIIGYTMEDDFFEEEEEDEIDEINEIDFVNPDVENND